VGLLTYHVKVLTFYNNIQYVYKLKYSHFIMFSVSVDVDGIVVYRASS